MHPLEQNVGNALSSFDRGRLSNDSNTEASFMKMINEKCYSTTLLHTVVAVVEIVYGNIVTNKNVYEIVHIIYR